MNLIGKIFVFCIFVMSLVFMAFSVMVYGTHTNWKERVLDPQTGLKKQLDDEKAKNQALTKTLEQREGELTAAQITALQARAKAETENQILRAEVQKLTGEVTQLETARSEATGGFTAAQASLTALTDEVEKLRQEIRDAQQAENTAFVTATEKNQQLLDNLSKLKILEARQAELVQQLTELRSKVASGGAPGTPPAVQGTVLDVRENRIELSIGSDDGLQVGHELDVYRGSKYLGRVRVSGISPDRAVATVLPSYQQGSIQRTDNVIAVRQT
jgi:hypothetical protein